MKDRRFVDLFSGCGGLSLGLSMAGMQGLFAVERDHMAFRTFHANFVSKSSNRGHAFEWPTWLEQRAWGIDELLEEHKADLLELRGKVDVLAGGPPCQGFSFAGRRVEDDPRNQLFHKYVEAVDAIRPAALILENVPGMRVVHRPSNVVELQVGPAPKKRSFYDRLVESLDGVGYRVEAELVDASRFGVPQKRSRLIAIGVRQDLAGWLEGGVRRLFELLEEVRASQLEQLGLPDAISAREAISDLEIAGVQLRPCEDPESPRGFQEARRGEPATRYQRLMRGDHERQPDSMRLARHRDDVRERFGRILAECRRGVRMDDEARRGYGLKKHRIYPMSPTEPAPTITTLPDDVLHYSEPRILTVRESARLQSFPDWFQFKGKFTTGGDRRTKECPRYTQVGNAVPPYLARAIGSALCKALDEIEIGRKVFGQARKRPTMAALG
ncbi:site-specific DNA methylase [Mesorhizobium australicum WSM2073]|uniref:Cytosine-specific methyltransferase n=1 Tax=Mesorhizobium australicum (strain HAMBI 3006 / LMG 24608 / WSM2073) TaxID=754035 RepID=L0KVW8_MESAW|nr:MULTISPECIES: DNA cytosine methyltransferase [Mesorhizobium]AGB48218.1 site-specific DNA methylase [Mesorhizobium australicum WSM2073]TPI22523.1 DNA cytosine methyltransferase [Mesorhizobium sp. B4-1-1]